MKLRVVLVKAMAIATAVASPAMAETLASAPLVGGPNLYCHVANVSAVPVKVRNLELVSSITGQSISTQSCGSLAPGVGCMLFFQTPGLQLGAYCRAMHFGTEGSLTGALQVLSSDAVSVGTTHMWRVPTAVAP